MNDETRQLLKIFGVAVTDFKVEAEKLAATAAQFSPDISRDQVANLMKDAAELSRELNARWLEITRRVFALQERLLTRCAEAAAKLE
jgi:propanediol dehydratase small subunit